MNKPFQFSLLSWVLLIFCILQHFNPLIASENQSSDTVSQLENQPSKDSFQQIRKLISQNKLAEAATKISNVNKNHENNDLTAYSAGITLLLGMHTSAAERLNRILDKTDSLSALGKKIALPVCINLGNLNEASDIHQQLSKLQKIALPFSWFSFANIALLELNKAYFAFFLSIFILIIFGGFKFLKIDFNLLSIPLFLFFFAVIWLAYQHFFGHYLLRSAMGIKSAKLLLDTTFSGLLPGIFIFAFIYPFLITLLKKIVSSDRIIRCNEIAYATLLAGGIQIVFTFGRLLLLHQNSFSAVIILAGALISGLSSYLLWREYSYSRIILEARQKPLPVAKETENTTSSKPKSSKEVTQLETNETIRQLLKEENYKEADRVAQSFFILKSRAVRPDFMIRMIEIKLEIDKVTEAKDLLGKLEAIKGIEAKRQQVSLANAYARVCNGDLGGYSKAQQLAKEGDAVFGQSDLYLFDFCEGLFHFQKKDFQKAVYAFSSSLKNAKTAAAKMKARFWIAFCHFETKNNAELEKLAEENKKIMGLELVQSYKLMTEALLKAANCKIEDGIKAGKNALSFNETSAAAAFIVCRLATDNKVFSEAQTAALRIDKEHFLGHRALELTV